MIYIYNKVGKWAVGLWWHNYTFYLLLFERRVTDA